MAAAPPPADPREPSRRGPRAGPPAPAPHPRAAEGWSVSCSAVASGGLNTVSKAAGGDPLGVGTMATSNTPGRASSSALRGNVYAVPSGAGAPTAHRVVSYVGAVSYAPGPPPD